MKKQLVFVYTRINGIEKRMVNTNLLPKAKIGMVENREFHQALGLKVNGGVR